MPKIITATDYDFRKVVVVCLNPDALDSVHFDKAGNAMPHTDAEAAALTPPVLPVAGQKPYQWCPLCHFNGIVPLSRRNVAREIPQAQRFIEVVWTGREMQALAPDGKTWRMKTNDELLEDVKRVLTSAIAPGVKAVPEMVGQEV